MPFLAAGAILGSGLGGVAVTDRLLLLRLAPAAQVGEMFGLYGLAGRSAPSSARSCSESSSCLLPGVAGPVAYQVAILSLLVLMVVGFWIVRRVPGGQPALPASRRWRHGPRAGDRAAGRGP